jgi:DNA-binding MarR family transcriptional regulator
MRAVDLYSRRLVIQHGLSSPQLLCLRQLNANGSMLTGQLAKAMALSPGTLCGILDRLESRGLVKRERQIVDKRRVLVQLTGTGIRTIREAPPPLENGFLERLDALPLRRQAEIKRALNQLVGLMSASEIDAAPLLSTDTAIAPRPGTRPNRA